MSKVLTKICFANFLVVAAVFMQMSAVLAKVGADGEQTAVWALVLALFVVGLFCIGPFCSWLVDTCQRKKTYIFSLFGIMASSLLPYFSFSMETVAVSRFLQGIFCGLSQVALGSTLLNDLTTSERRTRSDYYFAWSAMVGLFSGVVAARFLVASFGFPTAIMASLALVLVSVLVVSKINVPFRAPIKVPVFSCDRFWLKGDLLPFINFLMFSALAGLYVGASHSLVECAFVAIGVTVVHLLRIFVFVNADARAEIVFGMVCVLASLLVPMATASAASLNVASLMFGLGLELAASRFLLYFLKLTGHCQRGTAQNTYMLSRESGFALGLLLAFSAGTMTSLCALLLVVVSLVFYLAVTHSWFVRHGNRGFRFREL